MAELSTPALLDQLQNEVRQLLISSLSQRAVSISSYEQKRTGNAYQPVRLGDELVRGFRAADRHIFAGIGLRNKTVIDLGCNLGEIVRDAIKAGAAHATGLEYDDYFVQVSRYVAAYNGIGNTNYIQGDLTNPAAYKGTYDVVAALSVHVYIKDFLGLVANMTKELLIFETHSIRKNWQSIYLRPLKRHFKHVALVGISDHKASGGDEMRYLLLCSQMPLAGYIIARARALAEVAPAFTIDMKKSRITNFDDFLGFLDLTRDHQFDDVLDRVEHRFADLDIGDVVEDVKARGIVRSPLYWVSLMLGFLNYRRSGTIDIDNFYIRAARAIVLRNRQESAFSKVAEDSGEAVRRFGYRIESLGEIITNGRPKDSIIVFDPLIDDRLLRADHPYLLHIGLADQKVWPLAFDGHHRLFACYLAKSQAVPCMPIWYDGLPYVERMIESNLELQTAIWDSVYPLTQPK